MAILFYDKKQKKTYLILGLVFLLVIIALIWFKFIRQSPEGLPPVSPDISGQREKKIEIDFEKLETQLLKDLQPFKPISPPQEGLGRENPFAPAPPVEE